MTLARDPNQHFFFNIQAMHKEEEEEEDEEERRGRTGAEKSARHGRRTRGREATRTADAPPRKARSTRGRRGEAGPATVPLRGVSMAWTGHRLVREGTPTSGSRPAAAGTVLLASEEILD